AAFEAQGSAATLAAIISDTPRPLCQVRPDVPPDLESVIMRCLEKERGRRIQTVRELGIALQRFTVVQTGSFLVPAHLPPLSPSVPPNSVTVSGPRARPLTIFAAAGL